MPIDFLLDAYSHLYKSVCPSVGPSVMLCNAFVEMGEKASSAQFYHCLSMHLAFLCLFNAIRTHHWPLGFVFSIIIII